LLLFDLDAVSMSTRTARDVAAEYGVGDEVWAYRRLLLRDGRKLSDRQRARLKSLLATHDPTGEILAAWTGKECLRQLLTTSTAAPDHIRSAAAWTGSTNAPPTPTCPS
jgi:hypothetical protein